MSDDVLITIPSFLRTRPLIDYLKNLHRLIALPNLTVDERAHYMSLLPETPMTQAINSTVAELQEEARKPDVGDAEVVAHDFIGDPEEISVYIECHYCGGQQKVLL